MGKTRIKAVVLLLFTVMMFGLSFVSIKISMVVFPPVSIVTIQDSRMAKKGSLLSSIGDRVEES